MDGLRPKSLIILGTYSAIIFLILQRLSVFRAMGYTDLSIKGAPLTGADEA